MMWGAHHIGVAVPRGCPGRGTAVGDDGGAVEMQAYWTPDPTKADGADLELLEKMRPEQTRWPRRVVVPPEMVDLDGNEVELQGSYALWQEAELALLSDHPELQRAALDTDRRTGASVSVSSSPVVEDDLSDAEDFDRDYAAPEPLRVMDLQPGQMVLVDEPTDTWGVVETVEKDEIESDHAAVCWRSDDGSDFGVLSLDADGVISTRVQIERE